MKNQSRMQVNDLCEKLNMDFDEANELFGSETLDGMKMARICGAGDYWMEYNACITLGSHLVYGMYGGHDSYNPTPGNDVLICVYGERWALNGVYVKDVEVGGGTYFYSEIGTGDDGYGEVDGSLWNYITGNLADGSISWWH